MDFFSGTQCNKKMDEWMKITFGISYIVLEEKSQTLTTDFKRGTENDSA